MSVDDNQAQIARRDSSPQQAEYNHLKVRLDEAQLERTVAALHRAIPDDARAREAEATLRRMYERAKRWEN